MKINRFDHMHQAIICLTIGFCLSCLSVSNAQLWITYDGGEGPGKGKHIVLISGDEEYRSEEGLPMLARILSVRHGFKTTVLFAIDQETGEINPDNPSNIPGLKHLETADLMILFTRFRALPDDQMSCIENYLRSGKPIIGMRTATHAFFYKDAPDSRFTKYNFNSVQEGWEGGFGKQVLGETWVDHHGDHGSEGTRGLVNGVLKNQDHPVLRGVEDIWVPTDVYGIQGLTGNPDILVWGQPTLGMTSDSPVNQAKTIMPVAWLKEYEGTDGTTTRVFTTTMGASVDLVNEDLRQLLVNACYWLTSLEVPPDNDVSFVGEYSPTMFGFGKFKKGVRPADFK
jgi:hypothetical protein